MFLYVHWNNIFVLWWILFIIKCVWICWMFLFAWNQLYPCTQRTPLKRTGIAKEWRSNGELKERVAIELWMCNFQFHVLIIADRTHEGIKARLTYRRNGACSPRARGDFWESMCEYVCVYTYVPVCTCTCMFRLISTINVIRSMLEWELFIHYSNNCLINFP